MPNDDSKIIMRKISRKKMQQDTEIPAIVHEHINQAYHLIENNTVTQKKAPRDPFHWMKIGGRVAGGMAAVWRLDLYFVQPIQ